MNVKESYSLLGGTVMVSLGIGSLVGWFFAKKQLEAEYAALAEREIIEAKQFYNALHKRGKYSTPKSTVKDRVPNEDAKDKAIREAGETVEAVRAMHDYSGNGENDSSRKHEKVRYNKPDSAVIEGLISDDGFDYSEEKKRRSPDLPYVISKEEWADNVGDHDQVTLSYFVEDDTLAYETDEIVDDSDYLVGDDNLLRFGDGSGDPYVVYIRNEAITTDFEVVKDMNSYAEKILGFIKHADDRPSRKKNKTKSKFRQGDDE